MAKSLASDKVVLNDAALWLSIDGFGLDVIQSKSTRRLKRFVSLASPLRTSWVTFRIGTEYSSDRSKPAHSGQ